MKYTKEDLTANEQDFFNLLFVCRDTKIRINKTVYDDIDSFLIASFPDIKKRNDRFFLLGYSEKFFTEGYNLDLASSFTTQFICQTHQLMLYFDKDTNVNLVENRNNLLLGIIKVIYKSHYNEELSTSFADFLEHVFFKSTLVNFNPDIANENYKEEEVNIALANQRPSISLNEILGYFELFYKKNCEIFDFIPKNKREDCLKKLRFRKEEIRKEYEKSTQPSLIYHIKTFIFIFAAALCIANDQLLLLPGLFVIYAALEALLPHSIYKRIMNNNCQKYFVDKLNDHMNSLDKTLFKLTDEKKMEIQNLDMESRALESALYKGLNVKAKQQFILYKPEIKQTPVKSRSVNSGKKNEDQEIPVYIFKAFENCNLNSEYSINNLRNLYPRNKKVKTEDSLKKITAICDHSTEETKRILEINKSRIHEKPGSTLVNTGHSYAFFELGKLTGSIPDAIVRNLDNDSYQFGSKKGKFNVFKYVPKLEIYRLKLTEGFRVDYKKKENIEITQENGEKKSIHHYEAVNCGYKKS